MPDDISSLIRRFANIELEIAALRQRNQQLASANATLASENARYLSENEYYKSSDHCPLWPYEVVQMVQEELPGVAPMFFNDHVRALKRQIADLKEKYEPNTAKAEAARDSTID